jgi:hypothetical protein
MNIHLPAILMFTRGIGFWPIPISNGGYYYYGLLDLKIHIGYPIKENSQAEYGFDWK